MSVYDIRKFHLRMDSVVLARFSAASNAFKHATRRPIACKLQITDMYYGDIMWSGSDEPRGLELGEVAGDGVELVVPV